MNELGNLILEVHLSMRSCQPRSKGYYLTCNISVCSHSWILVRTMICANYSEELVQSDVAVMKRIASPLISRYWKDNLTLESSNVEVRYKTVRTSLVVLANNQSCDWYMVFVSALSFEYQLENISQCKSCCLERLCLFIPVANRSKIQFLLPRSNLSKELWVALKI